MQILPNLCANKNFPVNKFSFLGDFVSKLSIAEWFLVHDSINHFSTTAVIG